jgi:hypothetical protein
MAIPGFGDANYFGRAVASAGDINGDTVPDILVSGWIQCELGVSFGRVYVVCGLDGSVLKTITSFEADDAFGYTIVSLGDLTGDGIPEIAVAAPTAQTSSLGDGAVYIFDLSTRPVKHITTADAFHTIRNDAAGHDLFGSVLAYDDLQSTDAYDIVLIGSVDPASHGASPAQFIFSRHRVGYQGVISTQSTPAITQGDVIPDGKVEGSDVSAVTTSLNQSGTGLTTDPDLDGDGIITGSDLVIVLTNYGAVSSLSTMLADPSELVTRVNQLTGVDGGLTVEPGIGEPWINPPCLDDTDDIIDGGGGGGGGGGRPGIQPGFPGVQPGTDPVNGGGPGGPFRSPALPPTDDGEDCPDDDDGNCGCVISDDAPDDADCDAFTSVSGPTFIGKGMDGIEFSCELTSEDWRAFFVAGGSTADAIEGIQPPSVTGTSYTSIVNFRDDYVGNIELVWQAYNISTGVAVQRCITVNIVEYEPVAFQHSTFIPCEVVQGPRLFGFPSPLHNDWFKGDDRVWCPFQVALPEFALGDQPVSYKSKFTMAIPCTGPVIGSIPSCYNVDDAGEIQLGNYPSTTQPTFGRTYGYDNSSNPVIPSTCSPIFSLRCLTELRPGVIPDDEDSQDTQFRWNPCPTPTISESTDLWPSREFGKTNFAILFRVRPNMVIFRHRLSAKLPLIEESPHIDSRVEGQLEWHIDESTGEQSVSYTFSGRYDGYPAHEWYIGPVEHGSHHLRFDPLPLGHTIQKLWGLGDRRFNNYNGTHVFR